MCLVRLVLMIVGLLTVISIIAYAFYGYQWWNPVTDGSFRQLLILLGHFAGLCCFPLAIMPDDTGYNGTCFNVNTTTTPKV